VPVGARIQAEVLGLDGEANLVARPAKPAKTPKRSK
jgi:hypothetical protein